MQSINDLTLLVPEASEYDFPWDRICWRGNLIAAIQPVIESDNCYLTFVKVKEMAIFSLKEWADNPELDWEYILPQWVACEFSTEDGMFTHRIFENMKFGEFSMTVQTNILMDFIKRFNFVCV